MFRKVLIFTLMLASLQVVAGPPASAESRPDGTLRPELLRLDGATRGEMAAGLLQAAEVAEFTPPDCVEGEETFDDVPASSPFCPWVEELVRRGITTGCEEGLYCPSAPVSRTQMAVFLVRSLEAAKDLFAVVDDTGELVRGRGAVNANAFSPIPGTYQVFFDTDVSECAFIATIGVPGTIGQPPGIINTALRQTAPTAVLVQTRDSAGQFADRGFHLSVVC